MVRCPQLPEIAVQQIVRAARGCSIPGTNKYARVCRQWRDVSEEGEPLQLFMNLSHLSDKDLARATSWLARHGQHVDVLVIEAAMCLPQRHVDLVASAAQALANLRRLEVTGCVSLFDLEPYLQYLPQLQHLGAEIGVSTSPYAPVYSSPMHDNCNGSPSSCEDGWEDPPLLQQLCPQLTSLDLTLQASGQRASVLSDLSWLLNPGLQQLTLIDKYSAMRSSVELYASSLGHLSALRQLTLEGVVLRADDWEVAEWQGTDEQEAQGLGALQELRVYHPHSDLERDHDLVHLAHKLVDYEVQVGFQGHVGVLTSYVHLTRLVLTGSLPAEFAAVLPALTALQELGLQCSLRCNVVDVVQQVAGMAQLRSLQLDGCVDDVAEVASCLAHCRQLTSLGLLVTALDKPAGEPPYIGALQQLTGLRRLTVYGQLLLCQQGSWLAALSQLTCLYVQLSGEEVIPAEITALGEWAMQPAIAGWLLEQVQPWPAQLQQVMFELEHYFGHASIIPQHWQFAAAPGGAQVTVWLEECDLSARRWARPLLPCPHLPGVWELQGLIPGRAWHMVGGPTYEN
jgi:hypothetical protein